MRKKNILAIAMAIAVSYVAYSVEGATITTWNLGVGGSWNTPTTNWNPNTVPNAIGDSATFNSSVSGSNPVQTANRSIALDGSKTVGSITFNNDSTAFTNTIATGSGGPLVFDEAGAGPATIAVPVGAGTGNNTISVAMTMTDSLVATVNNTAASSAAGSLNLTGTMSGAGGFTKSGPGMATLGTGTKTYGGPTVLNGGRLRVSQLSHPSATSSFTINAGAQLDPIAGGDFSFNSGSGTLFLNGTGLGAGDVPGNFPGAIRADTGLAVSFSNPVELQSDTLLHVQGAAAGSLTFSNVVSGVGKLSLTAPNSSNDLGKLVLNGANTYVGGTLIRGGTIQVTGANATLGTGDVTVLSGGALAVGAIAKLTISAGVLNAINDTATLSLAGTDGTADLGAGIFDYIGGLVLGGVPQLATGTYGSVASGADHPSDVYFSGTGVVVLVPEPATFTLFGLALMGLAMRFRKR